MADTALTDAGSGGDPLVGGVDESGKIIITEHRRWYTLSPSGDFSVLHSDSPISRCGSIQFSKAEMPKSKLF
jgi:hypothetical protein